jgi:polar amino acid transport system substrate-binding protein
VLGVLCGALLGATAARAETLVIAGDVWCPVNCAADAAQRGIFVELAEQIFAEAGIKVEYRVLNWARAVHDTRLGKLNALVGAGVEDAPDFLFSETAPGISRMCFYAQPARSWRYQGLSSLADVSLGAINGYSYGKQIDDYILSHRHDSQRVQMASGDNAGAINVEKVQLGRIDVVLANTWVTALYLSRNGMADTLEQVGCRVPDVPIYLAFSPALKSSKRYVELFEQGLQRSRANGRLQALLRAYGVYETF